MFLYYLLLLLSFSNLSGHMVQVVHQILYDHRVHHLRLFQISILHESPFPWMGNIFSIKKDLIENFYLQD